jgi:hypothetical protein
LPGQVAVSDDEHDGVRDLLCRAGAPDRNAIRDTGLDERLAHIGIY